MKEILNYLFEQKPLSQKEAKNCFLSFSQEKFNSNQIAAFSAIYNMRYPTLEEIKGFSQALIELSIKIDLKEFNAINIAGTGGDNKNSFNISTLSCFILASLGEKVIKHGSYSSSSVTGSSNIFEILQNILYADINWDIILLLLKKKEKSVFKKKYHLYNLPISRRDISLLIENKISFEEIKKLSFYKENNILKKINLLDEYNSKKFPFGKKSYTLSFFFKDKQNNLTETQIEQTINKLKFIFIKKIKAIIR